MLFLLLSCKKKDINSNIPEITSGNVEFYFNGKINNQPTIIEAGKNDYYMYSSYIYDTNINTYIFEGLFKPTNCTNCTNTLKISITDDTVLSNNSSSHINNLVPGNYQFLYSDTSISMPNLSMNIYAVPIPSVSTSYQYILDGINIGNTSNVTNYTISPYTHTLTCLMDNYTDSCYNNSLTNILSFTPNDNFYAFFNYSVNTLSNTVTFTINTNPPTTNSYTLFFGDSIFSISSNTIITHYYPNPNTVYTAKLIAKSNNNKIWTFQNYITLNPNLARCLPNYYYNFISSITSTYTPFSKIKIEYISSNNQLYSSKLNLQPSTSYFNITSIQNYKNNEQNQPTKKISAQFKCRLFNISNINDYVDIEGTVVFAVAYK